MNRLTSAVWTPHVRWVGQFAPRSPRVLFIIPRPAAREVVELQQRFPMSGEAVAVLRSDALASDAPWSLQVEGTTVAEKVLELDYKLSKEFDAIVLANVAMTALPHQSQQEIWEKITAGTGLLVTYRQPLPPDLPLDPTNEDRDSIFTGVPFTGLPYFRAVPSPEYAESWRHRLVSTYQCGKGRVAVVDYGEQPSAGQAGPGLTPPVPYSRSWETEYNYYLSLVAKVLLWTMPSLRSDVALEELADGQVLEVERTATTVLRVRLNNLTDTAVQGKTLISIRNRAGEVESQSSRPLVLAPGANDIGVPLVALSAGGHFVDVVVESTRGTETWGSAFLYAEAAVGIAELKIDGESYELSQAACGQVTLTAPATSGCHLDLRCEDTHGREYAAKDLRLRQGETSAEFLLPVRRTLSVSNVFVAKLLVGSAVADSAERTFRVHGLTSEEFPSLIWYGFNLSGCGLDLLAARRWRQAGFNLAAGHVAPEDRDTAAVLAAADLRSLADIQAPDGTPRASLAAPNRTTRLPSINNQQSAISNLRGAWWGGFVTKGRGGAREDAAGITVLWRQLLSGTANASYWFGSGYDPEGMLGADLRFAKYFEDLLPELRFLYSGVGQLLRASYPTARGEAVCQWTGATEGYFRVLENGTLTLVGLILPQKMDKDTAFELREPLFVYDVRTGTALGQVKTVPVPANGPRVRLFSLLPKPAKAVTLAVPEVCVRGQDAKMGILVKEGPDPVGRILRVQLSAPADYERPEYRRYLRLTQRACELTIPHAFNDWCGLWTVTVTDVATGLTAKARYRVVP